MEILQTIPENNEMMIIVKKWWKTIEQFKVTSEITVPEWFYERSKEEQLNYVKTFRLEK